MTICAMQECDCSDLPNELFSGTNEMSPQPTNLCVEFEYLKMLVRRVLLRKLDEFRRNNTLYKKVFCI